MMRVNATTIAVAFLLVIAFWGPTAWGQTLFIRDRAAPTWELYRSDERLEHAHGSDSRLLLSKPVYPSGTLLFPGMDYGGSRNPIESNDPAPQSWNGLSLQARIPLSRSFDLYARGGTLSPDPSASDRGFSLEQQPYSRETPFFGAGAEFRLAEPLRLFVEYTRYETKAEEHGFSTHLNEQEANIDTAEVGLTFVF